MSYVSYLLDLPSELQRPLVQAFEMLEQNLRAELAVRRQDILDMQATLLEFQQRTDERFAQTQEALAALAEAQKRTEQRVEELAEAQRRSEERIGRLEVVVAELAEAQKRTEQRVEELAEAQKRTEQRVEELAEAQRRSEERIGRLEVVVAELAEAQKRTEQRVEELAEAQKRTEQALAALSEDVRMLTQRVARNETTLGRLVGDSVERRYRERAGTYLAKVLQKVRLVSLDTIMDDLEKVLDAEEIDELLSLDLLLSGKVRQLAERPEVWIACEASSTIERDDVTRARRRADLLRKAGYPALAAVAGEQIDDRVLTLAQKENVLVWRDGTQLFWQEALQTALAM